LFLILHTCLIWSPFLQLQIQYCIPDSYFGCDYYVRLPFRSLTFC
jgi:hypothetical protein